jgi:nucleoside-diphosphate-sugar epimerase
MRIRNHNFKASQALPRLLADYINILLCMAVALALPILYFALTGAKDLAVERLSKAVHYFGASFAPRSIIFPIVFLLNGFYTRSRAYIGRYKILVLLRGIGLSILFFITSIFFVPSPEHAPRIVVLLFCGLTMSALVLSRVGKQSLVDRFEIKRKPTTGYGHSNAPILVIGGAGYIGSCLVRQLLRSGRRVRVMDSLLYGDDAIHDLLDNRNFSLQVGDCRNIQNLVAAVKGVDSIIHLAAIVGDGACDVDPQTSEEVNYAATRMLIEVAKGNGIKRLIFTSSCSVYGATDYLMGEFSIANPISLYGRTKVDSERVLLNAVSSDFHPVILRLATVFGLSYRPRFDLVVNLLTAKAHGKSRITIFNGTQWRPFIHVQDVARGLVQVLDAPLDVVSGEIYNLGDSRMNFTLSQVSEKILAEYPGTAVEHVDNNDRRSYHVSFEKIYNQVGFQCSLTLEDGIREMRKAFEDHPIPDYTDARYYNQKFLETSSHPVSKDELDRLLMAAFVRASAGTGPKPLLVRGASAA